MRGSRVLVSVAMAVGVAQAAPYQPTSPFFLRPDTGRVLLKQTADFWKPYRDDASGGYNAVVSASGSGSGSIKFFSPQSRLAYVFTRAFMVTGDTTYLNHAEHALKFLYAHAWDTSGIGGWFYEADKDGRNPYPATTRWSYMQHYALLGPTVFWEAHGGQKFPRNPSAISHWDWIRKGSDWMESKLWDATPGREGYYTNWYPTGGVGKGFTGTVDGITTHGEALALITREPSFRSRFLSLGDAMADHLAPAMDSAKVKLGMPEDFTTEWRLDTLSSYAMVGHIVKTVWCLDRVYMYHQDPRYLRAAERIFRRVWLNGFVDTTGGGIYSDYSWKATTLPTTQKNYWMLEQGFNAGITLGHLASDPLVRERALRMAEGSVDFFYKNLYQKNGGAIMATTATGTAVSTALGDEWDAGYHASEFSWLVYLFGHLLHQRDSVSLFYRLAPSPIAQDIPLSPMSLPGDSLAILWVQKDGAPFDRIDQAGRILHLDPDEGGIFRVTFGWRTPEMSSVQHGRSAGTWSARWDAATKTLRVESPVEHVLNVRMLDVRGRTTVDLGARRFAAGESSIAWPGQSRPGLRWILLEAGGVRQLVPVGL